jgi:hypothetical protein
MAAQMQGNDFITLTVGLPLLIISTVLASAVASGRLLLTGTLGFSSSIHICQCPADSL